MCCFSVSGSMMIVCDPKPNISNNLLFSHILQVPPPVGDLNTEISEERKGQPLYKINEAGFCSFYSKL